MIERRELTGAVLAGGHSSRFGSNKALQAIDGTTFLGHAIETLQPLCSEVVISASRRNADDYSSYGLRIINDTDEDLGPLGGIVSLLAAIHTDWLLVLTCDMPWLSSASLQQLLDGAEGYEAVSFDHSPLPLLIRRSALPVVQNQIATGQLSIKALLSNLQTHYIIRCNERELSNVNRKEDLN